MKSKNLLIAGALALSTVMTPVASMLSATPIFAADVEIADDKDILDDHTFVAYQIFSGKYADGALTDIQWGNGINDVAFLNAIKAEPTFGSTFTNCSDAPDVANALKDLTTEQQDKFAVLAKTNKNGGGQELTVGKPSPLKDGYYVIVDETVFASGATGKAYNNVLLEVAGDDEIVIELKTDVPTLVKKVKEDDKTGLTYGELGTGYNDVADYSIGETVPFGFESTVPDMSHYTTYEYKIHDTMSKGLTLDESSFTVTIGDSTLVEDSKVDNEGDLFDYTVEVTKNNDGTTSFELEILNLKQYTAGDKIVVTFNATLNEEAEIGLPGNTNEVYLEYSNKPGESGTGITETDKVIVFTYELDATKVDKNDHTKTLEGAKFKIHKTNDKSSDEALIDNNNKFVGWVAAGSGTELESDGNGEFTVIGLDSGTYYLEETAAPVGYTKNPNLISVTLNAATANGQAWNKVPETALTSIDVNGETDSGVVTTGVGSVLVENTSSSTLPETGGVGTTMLYAAGTILAGGAAVFYVTNKRMKKEDE